MYRVARSPFMTGMAMSMSTSEVRRQLSGEADALRSVLGAAHDFNARMAREKIGGGAEKG